MQVDPEAAQLEFLLQQYEEEQRLRRQYEEESVEVEPEPEFVVKTRIQDDDSNGQKLFINLCSSEYIDIPEQTPDDRYRIPVSCGPARPCLDKGNHPALAYDCILHPVAIQQCRLDRDYQHLIVQYCIENIETKYAVRLSRDIRFPKAKFLGGRPTLQRIRKRTEHKHARSMDDPTNLVATDQPSRSSELGFDQSSCEILQMPSVPRQKPLIEEISSTESSDESGHCSAQVPISQAPMVAENLAEGPVVKSSQFPPKRLDKKTATDRNNKVDRCPALELHWIHMKDIDERGSQSPYLVLEIKGVGNPDTLLLEESDWGLHVSGMRDGNIPLQIGWKPIKAQYVKRTGSLQVTFKKEPGSHATADTSQQLARNDSLRPRFSNTLQFQLI